MSARRTEDRPDVDRRRLRPLYVRCLIGLVVAVLAPAAVGVAATRAPAGGVQAGPALHPAAAAGPAAVPGEIVVGFRSGVDASERAVARSAADVSAERNLLVPGGQLVKVERGQGVQEAITELEKRPDVRYAEPNWIYHATATTPNDPRFGNEWGLNNTGQTINGAAGTADDDIDAPEAWDRGTGSASTVVAVVDSGVAWDHPDLSQNIWSNPGEVAGNGVDDDHNGKVDDVRGWDFAYGDNNPWDYDDHGTHVAGTIAARGNNGVGITGVAWQASIMPVQALDATGSGSNAAVADAFTYAAANGARVVNASLGGPFRSQAMSDAIATHPDTLYVVAAGNDGTDNDTTPGYPCNDTWANLICVAATGNTDTLASFSNYGASSVDLAAPGVDIDSTRPHYTDSFTDNFETSLGNWTVQSGPWGRVSTSGSIWLTDSPGVNYADNADWAIRTTSKVDVGARSDCIFKFGYGTFLENGADWLYVQSSTDGTTWTDLGKIGDTNGSIEQAGYPLSAGGSRYYRFRLTSNATVNKSGAFIDNVRIGCPGGTYGAGDYQFSSGTSMAAPHVAGAATMLFSDTPAATVGDVKAALVNSGDAIAGLSGKTVSGRRLNLDAALRSLVHKENATTTIISHDPNPSPVNQPLTVKYSVTGASGTPTGNVTVTDGSSSCTGTVAAGQCTITWTTQGSKTLVASYSGDATYSPGASASVSHTVGKNPTTTSITSDLPDPSAIGQAVTVNYSVTSAGGTPTGTVRVSYGVQSCEASVSEGSCAITLATPGTGTLTARYLGDSTFESSTSAGEPHTVKGIMTATAITADDPDPSVVGQAVTVKYKVTGNVPGGGAPSGNVTVTDGSSSCTGTTDAGQCAITFTTAGAKSLTATYAGDDLYAPSATPAAVSHQVNPADTTTTITARTPDASVTGQAVTVHYDVAPSAPGAGTPSGAVTVGDGTTSCTATVAAGECTLTFTSAGDKRLTATYGGAGAFTPSTSPVETHTVDPANTVTAITADGPDASAPGAAVTVEYTVKVSQPGAGTPTGTVTVSDGVDSCTSTVAAGRCTIALTSLGSRTLTADYAGDSDFRASRSPAEPHTVAQPTSPGGQPPTANPPSSPGAQPPAATPASPPPAHVSGASQTNPRFRVSAKKQLARISRRRAPVGTTFKYTLDTAATVRLDFTQPAGGRQVNGKCVPPTKRNRRKPGCALGRGSLTFAAHAGLNTVRFAGWLSRTRKLTPGKHTLTITAITPGIGATSQQLRFTIVR